MCACSTTSQPCESQQDCGGGQTCLQIGSCAPECNTSAQCGNGEKCSVAGGCVLVTGCGADLDCPTMKVCGEGATCVDSCLVSACQGNQVCGGDGHCYDPADGGTSTCGGQLFQASRVEANFLIVLDHSGSMMETVSGKPKWSSAVDAITTLTQTYGAQIRFGLQLFSFSQQSCDPGQVYVDVGAGTSSAITQALPADADGRQTPVAGALAVAKSVSALKDTTRSNNVLLITDGKENCNGDPVAEVKALFGQGVKTYVVGFGGQVDAQNLSDMATSGGTAQSGGSKYFQADNPAALNTALSQAAQGALGCAFQLTDVPPDPSKVSVVINGQLQPRDPAKQNGWEYDKANNRVTLYGQSCSIVAQDPNAAVRLVYGCPDDFIDGSGYDVDAGQSAPPPDGGVEIG